MDRKLWTASANADKTEDALLDFIEHLNDDLPSGPQSEHGDFLADRFLIERSEAEFRRMAAIGRAMIDDCASAKNKLPSNR